MKNKLFLAALSKLLKTDETGIIAIIENEAGDDSVVNTFISGHKIYTPAEEATLIANANKAYLENADFEPSKLPQSTFKKVAAVAFRDKEKALAKKYNITDYTSIEDLTDKIAELGKGKGADDATTEQIRTLTETVKRLEQEKIDEVKAVTTKFETEVSDRDYLTAWAAVNLDVEADKEKGSKDLLSGAFNSKYKRTMKDGKTVVLNAEGKVILDRLGNPEQLSNLITTFVSESGFKIKDLADDGRGGKSSEEKGKLSKMTFDEYKASKGITGIGEASDAAHIEWKAAQKTT